MRRGVRGWSWVLVGLLVGYPVPGSAQTAQPKAADLVGTWVVDLSSWDRESGDEAALKTITLRPDSVMVGTIARGNPLWTYAPGQQDAYRADGTREPSPDTVVSMWRGNWGRVSGDTLIWIGRDTLLLQGQELVLVSSGHELKYTRAPASLVLTNRLHPRSVAAPTGPLAQAVGTWAVQDMNDKDPQRWHYLTIRPDRMAITTELWMSGTDTTGIRRELNAVTVAAGQLWWGKKEPKGGTKIVVDKGQLAFDDMKAPRYPGIYKKISSSTTP